jgi:Xaa-Pro aminopeptidase
MAMPQLPRVVVSSQSTPSFESRIAAVRLALRERGIDCLLVSSPENVRYLAGFAGSAGWVLVSAGDIVLATDARYTEEARRDCPGATVRLAQRGLIDFVTEYATEQGLHTLGFEGEQMPHNKVQDIRSAIARAGARCEATPTDGIVEHLRMVKDEDELEAMARAASLADGAIAYARTVIRCGMTERDIAWHIERWLREHGSEHVPFQIIVASGPNAALPHATPGDRQIAEGEPIVIDLGATWAGYCSDLTRTLFMGHMSPPFDAVYRTVLSAQKAALAGVRTGMRAVEVDEFARRVIRDAGLESSFTHGLGHGVGLQIHETPGVSSRSTDVLQERVTFTIEPGVYLPGHGGVRIEDTVVLLDGRAQSLTHSDKDDPIIEISCEHTPS